MKEQTYNSPKKKVGGKIIKDRGAKGGKKMEKLIGAEKVSM